MQKSVENMVEETNKILTFVSHYGQRPTLPVGSEVVYKNNSFIITHNN